MALYTAVVWTLAPCVKRIVKKRRTLASAIAWVEKCSMGPRSAVWISNPYGDLVLTLAEPDTLVYGAVILPRVEGTIAPSDL